MGIISLETIVENDDEFEIADEHPASEKEHLDYLRQGEVELATEVYDQIKPCYQ
jgi:hypothetical protein